VAELGDALGSFRSAGRTLFSLGLVRGAEGNLSTFDGERLLITRTGVSLADLGPDDVLEGTLTTAPVEASSDLREHVDRYRQHGPGAVAHAHPAGTVPDGWVEGRPHGRYAHAATLEDAVAALVDGARGAGREGREPGAAR
jgi:hypothetical protein